MNLIISKFSDNYFLKRYWLLKICIIGTVLSVCILSASSTMRLMTTIDPEKNTVSLLALNLESVIRLVHRICASTVALISFAVLILSWQMKHLNIYVFRVATINALSVMTLAIIGTQTVGYKYGFVTLMNIVFGIAMLATFWWLSETISKPIEFEFKNDFSKLSIKNKQINWLIFHIATGAATSAWYLYGIEWPIYIHFLTFIKLMSINVKAEGNFEKFNPKRYLIKTSKMIIALQFITGCFMFWQDHRSFLLSFSHAVLSYLLILITVSSVVRKKEGLRFSID